MSLACGRRGALERPWREKGIGGDLELDASCPVWLQREFALLGAVEKAAAEAEKHEDRSDPLAALVADMIE